MARGDTENFTLSTRFVTTVEERKQEVLNNIKKIRENNYQSTNIQSSALTEFLGNKDVKEYYATLMERLYCHNGKAFMSDEEVEVEISEYLKLCSTVSILPTISGLSCYLGVTSNMLNRIANDPSAIGFFPINKFKEFIKNNLDIAMSNGKIPSTFYTVYMSHYFGVNQSANINMSTTLSTTTNSTNTLNLIRQQVLLENDNNADISTESDETSV